jgi:uncharacterized protein YndB with AHSA1/START domain
MEAKDGSFGFDFEAVYDAITPYSSFTYTMPDNRRVHFSLTPLPGHATEVVIVFDAETENSIELQRDGWQAILHSFKHYTERLVR